jgi:hypothetical protein
MSRRDSLDPEELAEQARNTEIDVPEALEAELEDTEDNSGIPFPDGRPTDDTEPSQFNEPRPCHVCRAYTHTTDEKPVQTTNRSVFRNSTDDDKLISIVPLCEAHTNRGTYTQVLDLFAEAGFDGLVTGIEEYGIITFYDSVQLLPLQNEMDRFTDSPLISSLNQVGHTPPHDIQDVIRELDNRLEQSPLTDELREDLL